MEWVGEVDGWVEMIDQTRLPASCEILQIRTAEEIAEAIRRLSVRGAPAIGVAAAYGVVLGARSAAGNGLGSFQRALKEAIEKLAASRPTAVNLFWALKRMEEKAKSWIAEGREAREVASLLLEEARAIHREDAALCEAIGRHGAALLRDGETVLTHCNAGALATGGLGTALAVIYRAVQDGKKIRVYADETRPLLQGARLTAWELVRAGIEVTLLCDSAAPVLLRAGRVDAVVVGADRIARNGDAANKIGTYGLAVHARGQGVPFYIAAPSTTFDLSIASGRQIPIEERRPEEVTAGFGLATAPEGVRVYNPAFDVTPAALITAFITEHGVIRPPYRRSIAAALKRR
ncbi:MAG: S-methyl-5-thioribose-1-phosphate isomerase [Planctomycetes bacterium]|nr:S-methyl-5-thioribose-1-phosphate isomerase [Planctomycetota bacterium]